jgi:hypothetical protein
MPEPDIRSCAFYDHEADEPERGGGRRRRPVADWGVGDEVFARMPSRRFVRSHDGARVEHGGAVEGRRTIVIEEAPDDGVAGAPATRAEALVAASVAIDRPRREGAASSPPRGAMSPELGRAVSAPREAARRSGAVRASALPLTGRRDDLAPRHIPSAGTTTDGRRTIVIGGHPDRATLPAAPRRPPRTPAERVGPRPDRIVAYAVALGFLLILIALLTSH